MKKNLLVLGYFGYLNNQLDGQTIKTRNIYNLLKSKEEIIDYEIEFFDTQILRCRKINLLKMFFKIYNCKKLVYIPAHNNLQFFFPFFFIICKLKKIDIHYIVVGGWLSDFLKTRPLHKYFLSYIKGIYPQTKILCEELKEKYNYNNVYQLINFRIHNFKSKSCEVEYEGILRLVFLGRVQKMKGVDVIFMLAQELKKQRIDNVYIDIYGPVSSDYKVEFNNHLQINKNVRYKGILEQKFIYEHLEKYHLMLFPTLYYTEGFPGSILDAYIAEVPVIVTKWKFANEFVDNNLSGIIVDFDNFNDFVYQIITLVREPERINNLQKKLKIIKNKYSSESAWDLLKTKIFTVYFF